MVFINMSELFSNREIAIGIWTVTVIIWIFVRSISFRRSICNLIRAIDKKIIIFTFIIIGYSVMLIFTLIELSLWDLRYLKNIIIWILFAGIPLCFNAIITKNKFYFSDTVKNALSFTIFIEFIVNTFTFNIFAELILVPSVSVLFLLQAVASTKEYYKPVRRFFAILQVIIGSFILYFAIRNAIEQYEELNRFGLFIEFSIPLIMMLIFLPLAYIFAIYSEYEILYKALQFRLPKNNKIKRKAKWDIFKACKFSRKRISIFRKKYLTRIYKRMEEETLNNVMKEFRLYHQNNPNIVEKIRLTIFT